jgi:hypothetical protein
MSGDRHEVRNARVDPEPTEIEYMCLTFQDGWTRQERRRRQGGIDMQTVRWEPKQYVVHHAESGQWVGGTCHMVQVWRCVDGT